MMIWVMSPALGGNRSAARNREVISEKYHSPALEGI